MGVFHVLLTVQMVPNRVKHHIYFSCHWSYEICQRLDNVFGSTVALLPVDILHVSRVTSGLNILKCLISKKYSEAHSEPSQRSKMEPFAKIVHG